MENFGVEIFYKKFQRYINYSLLLTFDLLLFGFLGPVLRSFLFAFFHSRAVQFAAHNVITHARQILHPAAANQNDGMLLQFVALARNISRNFHPVGQFHPGHLAQRRIRLFGRGREHLGANAPLERRRVILRTIFQCVESERESRRFGFVRPLGSFLFDKLMNCCHLNKFKIKKSKLKTQELYIPQTKYYYHTKKQKSNFPGGMSNASRNNRSEYHTPETKFQGFRRSNLRIKFLQRVRPF